MKKGCICKNGSTHKQSAENQHINHNKEGCPRVYFGTVLGGSGTHVRYKLDDVTAWLEKRSQEFLKKGGHK